MKKLLVIESSLNAEQGNSSKLAERYINVAKQHHDVDVTVRNIAQQALPHLPKRRWLHGPHRLQNAQGNKMS